MTDNEIIKALECCFNNNGNCTEECPLRHNNECWKILSSSTLDLINRQQAEIERLRDDNKFLQDRRFKELSEVRAEAIKEFAERLKKNFLALEYQANTTRKTLPIDFVKDQIKWVLQEVSIETIENLVKEMVGEE